MIKLGIVGTGGMANQRAEIFSSLDGVKISAVLSRSIDKASELAKSYSAEAFDDYDNMLDCCDAVIICSPNNLHRLMAEKAIISGKHVLVEYPLCINYDDAKYLQKLSDEKNVVLMVGNTIIHEVMFKYVFSNLDRFGTILSASSRVAAYDEGLKGIWYMNKLYSGYIFASFHYHHIEYYKRLLGKVIWAKGSDESILDDKTDNGYSKTSGGTLFLNHENGGSSCIQWYLSSSGNGVPRGMWINGTKSSLTIVSHETDKSMAIWDNGGEGKVDIIEDEWGVSGSCTDYIEAISGKLDYKERLASDIETLRIGLSA